MKHLAIMHQPFLDMILSGEKTIESRWTLHKIAPYENIQIGDEIYFKEVGRDVSAKADVAKVLFFELTPQKAEEIRKNYGKQIGIDKFDDWQIKANKKYCTLIWLKNVSRLETPMKIYKRNRAAWIIFQK